MKTAALALLTLLATTSAEASTRSYFTPIEDGVRIGACLSKADACGKIAADAFCQRQGFDEAIMFARETVASTRLLDSGLLCETGQCEAFKRVKCYQQKAVEAVPNS